MEYLAPIIILIFSIIIHEVSHGAIASYLGDPTAKYANRLTLNPLKHLDPIGSILVPIIALMTTGIGIGWAKPVPVNPYNLKDQKYGELKVAFAGPAVNLLIAIFFGLGLRLFSLTMPYQLFSIVSFIVLVNLMLAVFNLMPIYPLDGFHIFFSLFKLNKIEQFVRQYGSFMLLGLIFFVPYFSYLLRYIVRAFFSLIVG